MPWSLPCHHFLSWNVLIKFLWILDRFKNKLYLWFWPDIVCIWMRIFCTYVCNALCINVQALLANFFLKSHSLLTSEIMLLILIQQKNLFSIRLYFIQSTFPLLPMQLIYQNGSLSELSKRLHCNNSCLVVWLARRLVLWCFYIWKP